jgi:hypothetical protein
VASRSYVDVVAEIMHGAAGSSAMFSSIADGHGKDAAAETGRDRGEGRFLRENTDCAAKICLPSPYLIGERM